MKRTNLEKRQKDFDNMSKGAGRNKGIDTNKGFVRPGSNKK